MKFFKLFMALILASGLAFAVGGCSWDYNNPDADEWDVQIVGDSVFDLSGDIHDVLQDLSGKSYKDRAVSGAKIAAIRDQLDYAEQRDSLESVLADGGANDILQGSADCESDPLKQECIDVLNYVGDVMWDMILDMYYGPSDDHVWMGYYHVKGDEAEKNEAIDYTYDNIYPGLFNLYGEGSPFSGDTDYGSYYGSTYYGFLVAVGDPRDHIYESDLKDDDIHPTYDGSYKLAHMLWGVMEQKDFYR
ncbi:MAG: hypothetical protein ACLFNS_14350 [Desulfobacterales bacterium]